MFLFCSRTDTYGQVVLEAGASGLPVIAVAEGGPATLIENNHTGLLCQADADHLAGAICASPPRHCCAAGSGTSGVSAARGRSWERSLEQLAAGYGRAAGTSALGGRQTAVRAA